MAIHEKNPFAFDVTKMVPKCEIEFLDNAPKADITPSSIEQSGSVPRRCPAQISKRAKCFEYAE